MWEKTDQRWNGVLESEVAFFTDDFVFSVYTTDYSSDNNENYLFDH